MLYNRGKKQGEKTKELADKAEEFKSSISGLESDLDNIRKKIEEINKQKLEITNPQQLIELEKQTKELEAQEAVLKRQIELEKQKLEMAQRDATEQAIKASKETVTSHFQPKADIYSTDYLYSGYEAEQVTWSEELSRATTKTQELIDKRNELITQAKGVAQQEGETSQAYKSQQEQIANLQTQINETTAVGIEAAEALGNIASGLHGDEVADTREEYEKLLDTWNDTYNQSEENNEAIEKTAEELEAAGFDKYYVDHTLALYPVAASGTPWTATYFQSKGDPITDLHENMAAEQEARTMYENLLRLTNDEDVRKPLEFLRQREIVHYQRFGEALEMTKDTLNCKNLVTITHIIQHLMQEQVVEIEDYKENKESAAFLFMSKIHRISLTFYAMLSC